MTVKPTLEIAIATDSNYLVPTTVLLKSLFENNKIAAISVNLLHIPSLTAEKDLLFWESYAAEHGHSLRRVAVSEKQIAAYPELRHSKNTYLRLICPDVLPASISKVLYIDADTIVLDDLWELYSTDINEYYCAAVKEVVNVYAKYNADLRRHIQLLNIAPPNSYFGAGVMLMNLAKMRENKITEQFFNFALAHPELIRWSDQDIVNGVLSSSVSYIAPRYNMNYLTEPDTRKALWTESELCEVKRKPAIIHYIGPVKPWNYLSYHPKTKLWWRYLKMTPFKDFQPANKSLSNIPKKYCLRLIKAIDFSTPVAAKRKIGKLIPAKLKQQIKKWKQ